MTIENIINEKNGISYNEKISKLYPGYQARGYQVKSKALEEAKATLASRRDRLNALIDAGKGSTREAIDAQGLYDESKALVKSLTEDLFSGVAFVDQSAESRPYVPAEREFSIGDLVGRQAIEANRVRIPMDHYSDTTTAQIVAEGATAQIEDLNDRLSMIYTDDAKAINFDDILSIGAGVYADDQEVIETAIDAAHDRRIINAENKEALKILSESKSAIAVIAENLNEAINANLSGKAKRNAVIIVNKSGFAALDMDVAGVALVTRDLEGNLVYKHKYIIHEVPDEILPNNLDGSSPIVIGDIAHVLKFFTIRETSLVKDDIYPYTVADRRISKEIITITTKSDDAYIIGYIA